MNGTGYLGQEDWLPLDKQFGTLAIHSGYIPSSTPYNSIAEPISLSSTFEIDAPFEPRGFEYSRTGNPTRQLLEQRLSALEGGKHGLCFSSGLSAVGTVIALLETGDHIICSDAGYGGTIRQITESRSRSGISSDFVDLTDSKNLKSALTPKTKLIWMESPSNPTLKVTDVAEISSIAHNYSKDIIVAIDNTVLTPFFQKPLSLGVDIVHHSLTKYINGHTDVLMGALITSRNDLYEKLRTLQNTMGPVPSPFDCYLVLRGLKTLHVRMPRIMKNALAIAKFLESHPKVEKVFHPGLSSHPQHQLALKQSSGHSGLMSFYIKGPTGTSTTFLKSLKIFRNAGSLGGCESLAELPFYFTHGMISADLRNSLGITESLIRLSIGLESTTDLVDDINQALKMC